MATSLKSTILSTLLVKIRETPSPFAKVKQMIQDLVSRLEAEAEAEADQKSWCDENMKETTAERDTAQRKIEDLNALHTEKNAIEVLNSFYNPGATLLQQAPAAEGYERFSAENAGSDGKTVDDMAPDAGGVSGEYGGKTDASKSIITLLEQIQEDFASSITATEAAESAAQGEYDTFKSDTEADISDKGALKETAETDKTNAELDITQAEADLKAQKELLQAALDELEKLKPVCVDSGMSWEERSARRDQEIEALKEALKILQNTDFR